MPGQNVRAEAGDSALKVAIRHAERETIKRVLAQVDGNVARAAAELGILRTSLYRIMKRFGIATAPRAGTSPKCRLSD